MEARRLEIESANQEIRALSQHLRQIESRLEQSSEYVASVIDALRVPTVVLGPELEVREANQAFYQSFQAEPATAVGKPLRQSEGAHWEVPWLFEALNLVLRTGAPLTGFEFEMAEDGSNGRRWVAASANRLEVPCERMLVCCFEDITARKRAEMLLQTRLDLLGSTSAALALLDANQRILYVNPALNAMSGYSRSELLGQNVHQKLHAFHRGESAYSRAECPILAALRGGHESSGEELFRRKDGGYYPVRWQARPIHTPRPGMRLLTPYAGALELHDISGERQVLDTLLASQKLAAAGQAAATIAHEINNPLGAIGNALFAMRSLVEKPEPDRARVAAMIGVAQAEMERVSRIVQSTLGLYRAPEAAQPVDAGQSCQSAVELLQPRIGEKHIQLRQRLRAHNRVVLPPGNLRQVVVNLLSNALEAVDSG
ncbi:MAG: PAS domain-containing protein, partial [Terriglobales bacterium]